MRRTNVGGSGVLEKRDDIQLIQVNQTSRLQVYDHSTSGEKFSQGSMGWQSLEYVAKVLDCSRTVRGL